MDPGASLFRHHLQYQTYAIKLLFMHICMPKLFPLKTFIVHRVNSYLQIWVNIDSLYVYYAKSDVCLISVALNLDHAILKYKPSPRFTIIASLVHLAKKNLRLVVILYIIKLSSTIDRIVLITCELYLLLPANQSFFCILHT